MKKILIIASEPASGMIHFAVSLYKILEKSNSVEPFLLTQNRKDSDYKSQINASNHVMHVDFPRFYLFRLLNKIYPYKLIKVLRQFVNTEGFCDVHLMTGDFSLWLFFFLNRNSFNWFYTVHDLIPHEQGRDLSLFSKLFYKYLYFGEKIIRDYSPNLMTCSMSQYINLLKMYPMKRVSFVHFPSLVTNNMILGAQNIPELKNVRDYILFFGRVDYYKGIDILIEAYEKMNISNKLVVAGCGNLHFTTGDSILRINRYINDNEIKDLFSKALLVVLPYRNATMSGVFSLAMYYRKPIVASDIPFFTEYKDAGIYYFKASDVDSLSKTLKDVLSKDLVAKDVYPLFYSDSLIKKEMESFYQK